jgi:hypothetical protein
MSKLISRTVVVALLAVSGWACSAQSPKRTKTIALDRTELKLTPAALTFDTKGQIYVGHRDKGNGRSSSTVWIRVFDPATGRQLRSSSFDTSMAKLPMGATQFVLSPDDSLLAYAGLFGPEAPDLLAVLDAHTLQTLSLTTKLPEVQIAPARLIGFDPRAGTLEISVTRTVSSRFDPQDRTFDSTLYQLAARDLDRVVSQTDLKNPIANSSFAISAEGAVNIVSSRGLFQTTGIFPYDSETGRAGPMISVPDPDNRAGVRLGPAIFLSEGTLLLGSRRLLGDANQSGYVYRIEKNSTRMEKSREVSNCGIQETIRVSPDQRYGAALCERESESELFFGRITSRFAVIFDTKTLKILGSVPLPKNLYPEFAVWHGDAKIVFATHSDSNKLEIYELADQ